MERADLQHRGTAGRLFQHRGPRAYDRKVIIGNGGADYGVRGFAVGYDADTGKQMWKFYTVPGNPADGPDREASDGAMQIALPTWHGEWWNYGGGGTAWDAFAHGQRRMNAPVSASGRVVVESAEHHIDTIFREVPAQAQLLTELLVRGQLPRLGGIKPHRDWRKPTNKC